MLIVDNADQHAKSGEERVDETKFEIVEEIKEDEYEEDFDSYDDDEFEEFDSQNNMEPGKIEDETDEEEFSLVIDAYKQHISYDSIDVSQDVLDNEALSGKSFSPNFTNASKISNK